MSEFRRVQHAEHSPTTCAFCGTHNGPFIDTQFELIAFGRVYVCMSSAEKSGCVRQMARFDGMVEAEMLDDALAEIALVNSQIDQIQAELRDQRVVSMEDVIEELSRRRGGRPAKPKEEVI